ncbi:MAG: DUF6438 domain-containing protein [Myxococcaceae bacterium]
MRSLLVLVLSVSSLVACKTAPEAKPAADAALVVALKRTPCNGRCPSYTVRVLESGAVEFNGERDTLVKGAASATLDAAALGKLKARLEGSGFSQWKDAYLTATTVDQPGAELTFQGRTIKHSKGDETAPKELSALEDDVDSLIGTSQWVTGQGAPAL